MSTKVSVVIRCYNEERHIGRLLDGIVRQNLRDVQIVVVDSGSTDATVPMAMRYPVKLVSIPPQEFSFGRSLNLGCREADGELIVMASAHVYPVYHDWLDRMIAPFADPGVGLVYGKQRGNESTRFSEHQIFATWFPDEVHPDRGHPFCNNANAAIRRALWSKLPYDESLTGLEDLAWARRAVELGHRIVYDPLAVIIHVHEESWRRIYNRYRREAIALKTIYPHEHFGLRDLLHLLPANVLRDWHHARHDGVLLKNLLQVVAFRFMQLFGTYRGFAQRGPVGRSLKQTFYYPRQKRHEPVVAAPEPQHRIDYGH
jgi:glycosyltransferase involved in cell wall biosynthesis